MTDLLLNAKTKQELANFVKNPSHALLISGQDGSGRAAIARQLAAGLLGVDNLDTCPQYTLIEPDEKGLIAIDRIKQLQSFTKLKSESRRVIMIKDADKMMINAQDSLLKLLEEPPQDVFMILTALPGSLKPTILSRLQKVSVGQVPLQDVKSFFGAAGAEVERAYLIAGGRLGLVSELLTTPDHSLASAVDQARQLLAGSKFDRLRQVDTLSKDKDACQMMLAVLAQMAKSALDSASDKDEPNSKLAKWQKIMAGAYRAEAALNGRANPKLVLTDLMLSI